MTSVLRFIRGSLGTAVTWAIAWAVGGLVLFGALFAVSRNISGFWMAAPFLGALSACSGLIAGGVFSTVLATVYRRRRLAELSVTRLAIWGAIAGLALPMWIFAGGAYAGMSVGPGFLATVVGVMGVFGAFTAGATIGAAQANERALASGRDSGRVKLAEP